MNYAFAKLALLLLLGPVAGYQDSVTKSDCPTFKPPKVHKVSCLCGVVQICSGDICGSPSTYDVDDDITVELRTKNGTVLDAQKAVLETSYAEGKTLGGATVPIEQKERRFSFKDKPDGDYLLAFTLHKKGAAQPALVFPTNYSHKRKMLSTSFYMLEPDCPSR